MERVQKIISNAGIMSRRKAEDFIAAGKVEVNGKVIGLGDKADLKNDKIFVDGVQVRLKRKIYLMFHKPVDCLTTLSDPKGRKTVFDIIKLKERLIPVGRLDFKTEGLLLLTNDGDWANKIMHPRYEVKKKYRVYLNKAIGETAVDRLRGGVVLEDGKTRPAMVRVINSDRDIIDIRIHEGKNRIVRRMIEKVGYGIKGLIRIEVGGLKLANLPLGKYRKLTVKEINMFK